MALDMRLLNLAITYNATELHRLLTTRCDTTGITPDHTRVLLAALLVFLEEDKTPEEKEYVELLESKLRTLQIHRAKLDRQTGQLLEVLTAERSRNRKPESVKGEQ
jgi:hypothetical protein